MDKSVPLVLILLGPPGSGKGTEAALIKEHLNIPHISTGDLLRGHIKEGTALGTLAKGFIDKGELVPDQLILDMLFARLLEPDCARGYILDGVPRTLVQARVLHEKLWGKVELLVLYFGLSDEVILKRLTQRVVCSACGTPYNLLFAPPEEVGKCDLCGGALVQRADDQEAVILERLRIYHEQTAPLIAFYQDKHLLHTLPCDGPKEETHAACLKAIQKN